MPPEVTPQHHGGADGLITSYSNRRANSARTARCVSVPVERRDPRAFTVAVLFERQPETLALHTDDDVPCPPPTFASPSCLAQPPATKAADAPHQPEWPRARLPDFLGGATAPGRQNPAVRGGRPRVIEVAVDGEDIIALYSFLYSSPAFRVPRAHHIFEAN